ncbi:MAG: helix-turn-helix domain-containing protein [Alphaproteobacteria bacterium]
MARISLKEAAKISRLDESKFDATTDEDIARQIADDPDLAPELSARSDRLPPDPRTLRERVGMSQEGFARALGVPVATLRNWEQKRFKLDPAAVSLLRIVDRDPEAAFRLLGAKVEKGRMRRHRAA